MAAVSQSPYGGPESRWEEPLLRGAPDRDRGRERIDLSTGGVQRTMTPDGGGGAADGGASSPAVVGLETGMLVDESAAGSMDEGKANASSEGAGGDVAMLEGAHEGGRLTLILQRGLGPIRRGLRSPICLSRLAVRRNPTLRNLRL